MLVQRRRQQEGQRHAPQQEKLPLGGFGRGFSKCIARCVPPKTLCPPPYLLDSGAGAKVWELS